MTELNFSFISFLKDRRIRYVLAGGWNTIFGYGLFVFLYELFNKQLHLVVIASLSSFFAISMSFFTYKIFVFKTKGLWLIEWIRSFLVYGIATFFSILLLWFFVNIFNINVYFSQAISSLVVIIGSYFGHKKFTFKKND
jgi:putative flippase GtrA